MGKRSQAERVVRAFGGVRALHEALKRVGFHRSIERLYRWSYPVDRGGTAGLIPHDAMPSVLRAAEAAGVALSDYLLSPRER